MKTSGIAMLALGAVIIGVACSSSMASSAAEETQAQTIDKMNNEKDSVSYALGVLMGGNIKGQGFDLDQAAFTTAFFAAVEGGELLMDEAAANNVMREWQMGKSGKEAEGAKAEGAAFMAENGKRPEVTTTESGLQYEVLKEGTGASPLATDKVTVHYHGTLLNGEVFDSSVERGQTIDFPLNGVIPGWTEGLQYMKEGAKYKFTIPSDLAYGDQGRPSIPPGATLVFEVELCKVN